ncbi:class I adenylate-forming enzyme family protein [Actinomycetospora sp. TBRC 11914]|uniref:class I adenylate-forming enzyme family protein n=1 Tax=Actinomycetospora sp. TBRC 11914 TaxID=2729387 RepID=UPI00145E298C|nr:AMP-binding protein [Actinomycetospora sp. TBRC 11914]NMO91607.1 long-chain fatty acid--CoA ligase [Actinomycetospora sp. TBRC 11914]
MTGTVNDALRWWAATAGDHPALNMREDVVTYRDLESWTTRVGELLRGRGVAPGDRVGVIAGNSLAYCTAVLAGLQIGAVVAPFNNRLVRSELAELVTDCAPTVVVCDEKHRDMVAGVAESTPDFSTVLIEGDVEPLREGEDVRSEPRPAEHDDAAIIVYTSGTTSAPKGAVFTHGTIGGMIHEWSLMEPTYGRGGVRLAMVLPLGSAAGLLWGIVKTTMHGGTMFLEPRFDPPEALRILSEHQVEVLNGPPIIFEQIAAQPGFADADLTHLEVAAVGGARVPVELLHTWLEKGVVLRQIYGLTEGGGKVTINSRAQALEHPEQCGSSSIFSRIRVVDDEGRDCPPGEVGEILVRGPGVIAEYWRNEEATKAALGDGWLHTGDLGKLDEDGYLTYVDRLKELIISGGLNLSPSEVENAVSRFEGVDEVAVISASDVKFGETPAAVVYSSRTDLSVPDLIRHCGEQLADFKIPRYVIVRSEPLPRMASGKIAKRQLRDEYPDIPDHHEKVR